ncbi:MAG: T9SS type A sorting domain-containing protein, partial [Flavobacteriales bacterium]|nr:T9SS type A sorting domain-containing protein [Flavobacteriales bacterium]
YEYMGFPYSSVESIAPDPVNGGFYICGAYHGYDDGTVNDSTQRFVSRLYGLDVGVREVEEPVKLEVYPNPAHTSTTVRWARPGNYQLRLFDGTGREVRHSTHQGTEAVLDLTGLPAGPYLIGLTDRTHRTWSRTLIVEP